MKNISRVLSILIMAMMVATPFVSFATNGGPVSASVNDNAVATEDEETGDAGLEEEKEINPDSVKEEASQDADPATLSEAGNKKEAGNEEAAKELPNEPTEVTVVDSVEELSNESEAAYDNDAFFTIDTTKRQTPADLATDEVGDDVSDILSGGSSASKKQDAIIDTLEDSGFYRAEESGRTEVEVTSKFAFQRLKLVADKEKEINAYGATKAVYFNDSYLLSYDSMEATMLAYDALISEYGSEAVLIDMPMKLNDSEKGWGTSYMRMSYHKTLPENNGSVTVAVIDSGIMKSHPVFRGRTILTGKDFINNDNDPTDDNGHGTAVAGVIAESTPSGVRILPLKAMNAKGEGSLINVINATQYAEEQGADIINLSIGGYLDKASDIEEGERLLSNCNAMIVCAAGNENKNMDAEGVYEFPGESSSAVCVGAITANKERSSFSNYGSAVDFAAPGSSIMLATLDGSYASESGTSFSTPYLASAAALVKAGNADYTNEQIIDYLKSISEDLGDAGKDVYFGNGCPRFPQAAGHNTTSLTSASDSSPYQLSAGKVTSMTTTTAVFNWRMDRAPSDGAKVTINGRTVNPAKNSDGTYSYTVSGLNPMRSYTLPVKVINKNGKTISNVLNISVSTAYRLSAGKSSPATTTTAVFNWRMDRVPSEGAKVTINGRKINPTKNSDGTYSYTVSGLDPTRSYKLPVKIIDSKGRTISNTLNISVSTAYSLSAGKASPATSTTAVFNWRMSRAITDGARVTINGHKINPTKNSDGTYSYTVSGLDPTRSYKLPVKIIDSKGRTISNTLNISVSTAYSLSAGKASPATSTTAVFNWRMSRAITDGARVTINGRTINPTKNSDGTYSYNVSGLNPAKKYNLPVKVIDKKGRIISNVLHIPVDTSYRLSAGRVADRRSPSTAVFSWKMNFNLVNGAKITINGRAVNPTKNSDGTYSYNVSGLDPARTYNLPVKVIDKNGSSISNVMYVAVGKYTPIHVKSISISGPQYLAACRTYKLQATVNTDATNKSLSWSADNTSVATVDNSGRVTAIGNGTATIYVKALDGSGTKASYKIYSHKYTRDETKWIAHRGLHTKEIENTAAAFTAAGEAGGFWGCECDIFETKHDGEDNFDIVINHDASYKRVFGVDKKVNEVTADEIRNSTGPLRNVCFLKDYLAICKRYDMVPVIEFKGDLGFTDAGIEKAIKLVDEEGLLDDAYFVSFDASVLERVKKYVDANYEVDPYYGYLLDYNVMEGIELAKQKGFSGINLAYPVLTTEIDKKCLDYGLEIGTWTYGSDASIKYMYEHLLSDKFHLMTVTTDVRFFD